MHDEVGSLNAQVSGSPVALSITFFKKIYILKEQACIWHIKVKEQGDQATWPH